MSISSYDSDNEINNYDLGHIEEFEQLFGSIYQYRIDEIYTKTYKTLKWPASEVIELFYSLKTEYEKAYNDEDDVTILIEIREQCKFIDSIITLLESNKK